MASNRPARTRAGDKLVFHFHKTPLHQLVIESVERIEDEAYAKGYAHGMAVPDDPDLDTPVIPQEPT